MEVERCLLQTKQLDCKEAKDIIQLHFNEAGLRLYRNKIDLIEEKLVELDDCIDSATANPSYCLNVSLAVKVKSKNKARVGVDAFGIDI